MLKKRKIRNFGSDGKIGGKMMVEIREIKAGDEVCGYVQGLYESAFPVDERRDFEAWLRLLEESEEFRAYAIYDDGAAVGFVTVWELEGWRFAEHFAVDPARRSGGIGAKAFRDLLNMEMKPLILEVEPPTDELTRRRIGFYERLGMRLHADYEYIQPAYSPKRKSLPMHLMTFGAPADTDLNVPVKLIYEHVYEIL